MSDIQEQIKLAHKRAEENDYYFKKNNELSSLNTSLRSQRDELQNRINKAIEYLEEEGNCILNKGKQENERLSFDWENYYDLLDILKGSDNNE